MVESDQPDRVAHLRGTIRSFLESGYTQGDLFDVVTTATAELDRPARGENPRVPKVVQVFDRVPPHLITVAAAVKEFHVTRQAIYQWIQQGKLSEAGILRCSDSGQWNVTLLSRRAVANEAAHAGKQAEIYREPPDGLMTATEAAERFGISRGTVRSWIDRGHIRERGRLRDGSPGTPPSLISVKDVLHMLEKRGVVAGSAPAC